MKAVSMVSKLMKPARLIKWCVVIFACLSLGSTNKLAFKPKFEGGTGGELIFQSGFEGTCRVTNDDGRDADIVGIDDSLEKPNDWERDLELNPKIGFFYIYFEDGDSTQRFVKIIPEPGNPSNKVLHFWLSGVSVNQPPIPLKGRIQADLLGFRNVKELYQSVRVFIHPDFNVYKTFPNVNNWLTILEFWNNRVNRTEPFGFRISVNIVKTVREPVEHVYFDIHGQTGDMRENGTVQYDNVWEDKNTTTPVPIGKWFTLSYYFKDGGADNGRLYLTIQPDGECETVIFDINNYTHHPGEINSEGLVDANIMKLYTRASVIEHFQANGKALQMYWDDLKIWSGRVPASPSLLLQLDTASTAKDVDLSWETSTGRWSSFEIFVNGVSSTIVEGDINSFSLKGLTAGAYQFVVKASDACGNTILSNEVTHQVEAAPEAEVKIIEAEIKPRKIFSRSRDTTWSVPGIDTCLDCAVTVFTRSGVKVYESTQYSSQPWDATFNGTALQDGVYSYVIKRNGETVKSGTVTIIQ